ncbi:MAG: hypothetical protein ACR2M6_02190 [Vampirovibrionia bacterium]|jgi:hypothetical protein
MSTNLSQLPTDPSVPGSSNSTAPQIPENIKMETSAYKNDLDSKPTLPPIADTKQMNSMVSEIQNAAKQGLTRLAEDIPQQTTQITQDAQSLPNAIPESSENATPIDYIQNYASEEEIAQQIKQASNKQTTVEYILEEVKIPLMVGILFYLFQSKQFKKFLLSKLPSLFNDTGSFSTNGFLAVSGLFAVAYYSAMKVIKQI